jgi:hypothetical protein
LVKIRWAHSKVTGASATYKFQLDLATGDFSDPAVEVPVGDSDSLVLDQATIWGLLDDLGAPDNTPLPLKWRVVANNAYFGKVSNAAFPITLTKNAPTGVRELNLQNFVKVFPNPAKEMVKVSMDNSKSAIQSVVIMDLMGREIASFNNINAHETEINTSNLTAGIYILNVVNNQGSIASKRLSIN